MKTVPTKATLKPLYRRKYALVPTNRQARAIRHVPASASCPATSATGAASTNTVEVAMPSLRPPTAVFRKPTSEPNISIVMEGGPRMMRAATTGGKTATAATSKLLPKARARMAIRPLAASVIAELQAYRELGNSIPDAACRRAASGPRFRAGQSYLGGRANGPKTAFRADRLEESSAAFFDARPTPAHHPQLRPACCC